MTCLRLFIIASFLFTAANARAEEEYGYPIPGAYEATIMGTPVELLPEFPVKMRVKQLVLEVIPDRKRPPVFYYDAGLRSTFAWQKQKAPLVFLIAGAGASDRGSKLISMMKSFYLAGFHVITLPSPSNSNFIISASRSSIPGDMAEDSADLYRAMQTAWNQVKNQIEVSSFSLCGFSMGGIQSAFVAKLDEEEKIFNFSKVLMINPPVSLYRAAQRVEDLMKQIPGGAKKEGAFFNKMFLKFSQYYRFGNFIAINDDFLYSVYNEKLFSKEETAALIGLTYRVSLAGTIFTSDVMTNSGYVVPVNKVLTNTDSLSDYFQISTHLSYFNYFNEYLFPYFQKKRPGLTREAFIDSLSLRSIEPYLKSSAKFGVMTNENDFILSKDELEYLRQLFGERTKIYPRGGHLGNLEYRENLTYMVDFFKEEVLP
jgi:pimeloyl-ACP methyl ester carboxylesterase